MEDCKVTARQGWRLFRTKNECVDEFHGVAWGLFSPRGFCLLGIEVRGNYPPKDVSYGGYGALFGVVVWNRQFGLWNDPGY